MCLVMSLLVSCLGGMRGYGVVWTDLGALKYNMEYCESVCNETAVSWPVVGRFKARGGWPTATWYILLEPLLLG